MTSFTTNIENIVDGKKAKSISSDTLEGNFERFIIFLKSVLIILIIVYLYFSIGGLMLFLCKIAQSNILPTDLNCAPYTDDQPVLKPSPIVTNIFTTSSEPKQSMKLEIPFDTKNSIIEMFKKIKDKPNSNFLANYFISIIESILQTNYSIINMCMSSLNTTDHEWSLVSLGPILFIFLLMVGMMFNTLFFVYLWFSKMSWFFKTNKNKSGTGKPEWENVSFLSPMNMFFGVLIAIIFTVILITGFPIVSMIPLIFYHKTILSALFYKGKMNGNEVSAFTIISETMRHYKFTVACVMSIATILMAFVNLGTLPGIISVIITIMVIYGMIPSHTFQTLKEHGFTPLVSNDQAKRSCIQKIVSKKKWFGLFGGQNGGGNLKKQLQKIGKLL